MRDSFQTIRMFESPGDFLDVDVEALVGASTWLGQPGPRCRFVVKAMTRIRLDHQKPDEMFAVLNAECPGCSIRMPKTAIEIDVPLQGRIVPGQVSTHAIDEVAGFAFGQCR
ncbi:hypothetical protein WJ59_10700 [Burkholderia gladioli]|nr:hypothetical protein WJ59_10700 [Burkholderia gladioli]